MLTPLDELALLLRPAGGGLYLVSTGRAEQLALQRRLYGVTSEDDVQQRFLDNLRKIPEARAFLLGVPSDAGASVQRGANLGPQGIRTRLLDDEPDFTARTSAAGLVDLGDVFVVPQLLHDDMLSERQKEATRRALYPSVPKEIAAALPVSPLSIAERALDLVFSLNPSIAPIVLGGDHSTAWPVASAISRVRKDRWGIVQPDAHTDLLEERLGVRYCFATWSYHANELLGRGGRLVQVGTRASRFDRAHWESTLDVRQFWAAECLAHPAESLDTLIAHLRDKHVSAVYFSNDIDGTDARWADATGTPEPGGLEPDFVVELIRRLGREIGMLGGDVMEVAPGVRPRPDSTERTVGLAARYLRETITAVLSGKA
ncbi:MAG: arginase family protein [Byssovorax sp.]